jgi:tetratricopeptide (TPR) repeat protein
MEVASKVATRAENLGRLLGRQTERIAETLACLADETMAVGGDDRRALDTARRCARAAVELAPSSAGARLALAKLAAQQGDSASALAALRALLREDPRHVEALHELGMLLEERGAAAAARRCFEKAVRHLDPVRHAWAALPYLSLAELEREQGNRAAAMRWARKGLRLRAKGVDVAVLEDFLAREGRPSPSNAAVAAGTRGD